MQARVVLPSPPRPISFLQYLFGEAPRPSPAPQTAVEVDPEPPRYEASACPSQRALASCLSILTPGYLPCFLLHLNVSMLVYFYP